MSSRNCVISNINGISLCVREDIFNWVLTISDICTGVFVSITLDKKGVCLRKVLENFYQISAYSDYGLVHNGNMLELEFWGELNMTKITVEDNNGTSGSILITSVQFNTLLEFTRHAISDYVHADDSFYLYIYEDAENGAQ